MARRRLWARLRSVWILVARAGLRAALVGTGTTPNARTTKRFEAHEDDVVRLVVDAQFHRRGHEMRLILPGASPYQPASQPNLALVKAIARDYNWYEKLVSGEVPSLQSLAAEAGVNKRYVSRVARCVLLAPDIVDMILVGRPAPELTLEKLFDHIPMD